MNYRSLLETAALVGGALLVTLVISSFLDAWLQRPHTAVADSGIVEKAPLAAATRPAPALPANPVTGSRTK